jgi:sodium/hydrogen antiporter
VQGFSEQAERMLEVAVVVLVGGMLTHADFSFTAVLFVMAILFGVRPIAVYLTYGGRGSKMDLRPYLAWFGIRGIGSLYYLFYAMQHGLAGAEAHRLLGITLAVVTASVVIHGISVTPVMDRYRRMRKRGSDEKAAAAA